MARQAIAKEIPMGVCSFCKGEFEKKKMTTHLKHCKQRAAAIAGVKRGTRTKLFHILVEGRYNPEYWMHLEVPATEPLFVLDNFLRDIWVECCSHLSCFRIDGTSYDSEPEEFFWGDITMIGASGDSEETESAKIVEEGKKAEEEDVDDEEEEEDVEALIQQLPPEMLEIVSPELLEAFKTSASADDVVAIAKKELQQLPRDIRDFPITSEGKEAYIRYTRKKWLLQNIVDELEDHSLSVLLGKALAVGKKFTYEYDFGSTTELNLKVLAEREGLARKRKNTVEVMARNLPPGIFCRECGKPATQVMGGYYRGVEEHAYCDKCAKKDEDSDMMLPIVNSPRVGICGYCG